MHVDSSILAASAFVVLLAAAVPARAQELYRMPENTRTRWTSFENPTAATGEGGRENAGAKGHAFDTMQPGETFTLADIDGAGVIHRMWMTVNERSPAMLRSLRLRMTWDDAERPAVDVPLGDFFCAGLGELVPFENALFSSPEGRSFNFIIPMPFRSHARVELTNESDRPVTVFYDLNYATVEEQPDDMLYFHATWRRENPTVLGEDFAILPRIEGRGRFLGTNVGLITDPSYRDSWWGEGEVKIYLDDDGEYPTLVGTGTEDYIGTGWGQGAFVNRYQGAPVANTETRHWTFYRLHVSDPVYFHDGIRVTIQNMGGWDTEHVRQLIAEGASLRPVTLDMGGRDTFQKFFEMDTPPDVTAEDFPDGWVNFYRQDDISATGYFYLDAPESSLPPLAPVAERTEGLEP